VFAIGLAAFLIVMVAGIWISWSKETAAYRERLSR
jgi:cbb3-type cytochrome oxidase subunit 3